MNTIIVTGATGAMGWEATKALLQRGFRVIMACRNLDKAASLFHQLPTADQKHVVILPLELSDRESIRQFVEAVKSDLQASGHTLYALFNNAGTLQRHYHPNNEGLELTYATNYQGTVLLTESLLPLIVPGGAIVNTSSLSCYVSDKHRNFLQEAQQSDPKHYRQVRAYANSKMALTLYTQQLAQREAGRLRVNATDPGIVDSNLLHMDRWLDPIADLLFRPLCKRPAQGIIPAINALLGTATGHRYHGHRVSPFPRHMRLS